MQPSKRTVFTEDEYLALERASKVKHEFVDGRIVAMAGGTPEHSLIASNLIAALRGRLRGRCLVFNSDLRVNVAATGRYTYPDVTVVCGRPEYSPKDSTAVRNPRLVVEVLSPSTEDYDLDDKLDDYRRMPSVVEVIMVRADKRRVHLWHRTDPFRWVVTEHQGEDAIDLAGLGITLPLAEIYEGLESLGREPGV